MTDYGDAVRRQRAKRNPPIACTDADLREGKTADEPCPGCGHRKREHGFEGCEVVYHTAIAPNFDLTGPFTCGCREWDPMCTAADSLPPPAEVASLPSPGNSSSVRRKWR